MLVLSERDWAALSEGSHARGGLWPESRSVLSHSSNSLFSV